MRPRGYRIPDEPAPGGLSMLVVEPFWPLLATMMVGTWFGLAWLALNGFAMGSATRWRELGLCATGAIGATLLLFLFGYLQQVGTLEADLLRYLALPLIAFKLLFAYLACFAQQRSMELYTYFGGPHQNGLVVVLLGAFVLRPFLIRALSDTGWLAIVI